jgi:hypothetical protein
MDARTAPGDAITLSSDARLDAATRDARLDANAHHDVTLVADSGVDARGLDATDAGTGDGGWGACEYGGAPGVCILTSDCSAMSDHTSFAGQCPGPADIECCIVTPNVADNPPPPAGWVLMQQADVTSAMTAWAVMILDAPTTYPMFSTTTMMFGSQLVLARVEWHPPDFQNSVVHRGVTLYVPAG